MISCRRPSNRSSRLALPSGPANTYAFSTATHGIRRRSAASASRARVRAFSLTRSFSRAASHSCGDTIAGVFMACCPSFQPFSGDVVAVIAISVRSGLRRGLVRLLRRDLFRSDGADGGDDLLPAIAHVLERGLVLREHEAGMDQA